MDDWVGAIRVAPEVAQALAEGGGVVALESTLICHGLPWPENLATAVDAERAVRNAGAIPATVAVVGGRLRVGLEGHELEALAELAVNDQTRPWKVGRRDLSAALALGKVAATTVSATSWTARRVGIGLMATGGLGGVHRNAAETFDISADLDELARAAGLAVVCSGVKSILDVPATLEVLESLGVAVIGYLTDTFPAFTCRCSGLPLEIRVDSARQAAAVVLAHRELGLPGGIVIAQPVPEADALDSEVFRSALDEALAEAHRQGLSGKAVTPFLLDRIRNATAGESLRANRALIVQNASLAGQIAVALTGGR